MKRLIQLYGSTVLIALIASLFVFMIIDMISGKTLNSNGVVVQKRYREARTYVTLSVTSDGKGHTRTYPVVHHDPPEWHFLVKIKAGEIVTIDTKPDLYYRTKEGDLIPFATRYGGMTDIPYFRTALSY